MSVKTSPELGKSFLRLSSQAMADGKASDCPSENADVAALEMETDRSVTHVAFMSIISCIIELHGEKNKIFRLSSLLFTGNISEYVSALDSEFAKEKIILFCYFKYSGHFKNFLMSACAPGPLCHPRSGFR